MVIKTNSIFQDLYGIT